MVKKITSQKITFLFFLSVIFISFLSSFILAFIFLYSFDSLNQEKNLEAVEARMSSLFSELNVFPRSTLQDILFLSSTDETISLFNGDEKHYQDLVEFMKNNPAYYQLILVNDSKCLFNISLYPEFDCKHLLDSFTDKPNFSSEKVLISDIYFDSSSDIPTLDYISKVYSDKDFVGYILLRVNVNYFLEDIRREQREGEEFFLIRKDGEYLANKNISKEFNANFNFYLDNNLSLHDFEYSKNKFLQREDCIIFFKKVSISSGFFSQEILEKDNYWYLVSVEKGLNCFKAYYYFTLLTLFGICFLLSFLLFLFIYWRKLWK